MTAAGPATASSGRPLGGWHDLLRPRGHWTCGERNWQGLTASDAREHELFVQFEYVTSPVLSLGCGRIALDVGTPRRSAVVRPIRAARDGRLPRGAAVSIRARARPNRGVFVAQVARCEGGMPAGAGSARIEAPDSSGLGPSARPCIAQLPPPPLDSHARHRSAPTAGVAWDCRRRRPRGSSGGAALMSTWTIVAVSGRGLCSRCDEPVFGCRRWV